MRTEFIIQMSRTFEPTELFQQVRGLQFAYGNVRGMTLEQIVAHQQQRAEACLDEFPEVPVGEVNKIFYCGTGGGTSVIIRKLNDRQFSIHVVNYDSLSELQHKTDEVIRHILSRTFDTKDEHFRPASRPGHVCITEASNRSIKIMEGRIIQNVVSETRKRNPQDTRWGMGGLVLLLVLGIIQIFGPASDGVSQWIEGFIVEIVIFAGTTLFISAIGLAFTYFDIKKRMSEGSIIAWEEI